MVIPAIAAFGYGALALVGGIIGFLQVRSKVSLISGLVSGILLAISGLGIVKGQPWGLGLAIAVTILLLIVFVVRLIKTRKVMPAGLMVAAGLVAGATLLTGLG
ncbi:TMEM14 family protein [Leptolyngbya sp. PCC 6406]|uniref:TMEM14 family protein n=1 Tax=Leptolyngbya sp. PCC 6406 TaxID=1173264 RepID=UPI0002AB9D14|nr:TMEM14 family protein [Leptolyngbya sp. PCC 6406]